MEKITNLMLFLYVKVYVLWRKCLIFVKNKEKQLLKNYSKMKTLEMIIFTTFYKILFHDVSFGIFFSHIIQEALKRKLKARIEYAKFLQDTVSEMAKEIQVSHSGEIKQTAEDLDEFLNKVYQVFTEI